MPPDIDHELVGLYCLLTLAQTLGDAASLQDAEDEEHALTTPDRPGSKMLLPS